MQTPTTKDQLLYEIDAQLKAEIDVCLTHEQKGHPSIKECRHAILPLNNLGKGYVVYDRLLCRIVNGVYYGSLKDALECAQDYNKRDTAPQDMSPNGAALGLIYPKR